MLLAAVGMYMLERVNKEEWFYKAALIKLEQQFAANMSIAASWGNE